MVNVSTLIVYDRLSLLTIDNYLMVNFINIYDTWIFLRCTVELVKLSL